MTPEFWRKVCHALDELLPLPVDQRTERLHQLRQSDAAVAAEVEELLHQHETPRALDLESVVGDIWRDLDDPAPAPAPLAQPAQVGPYEVQEQVGRGGMGVVYRARDRLFRRSLAVKVLAIHHQDNADLKRRFLEEAQLMGQLQHPGIPPVHDLGQLPDGRPYFAMKLIKGRTLAQLLKERTDPGPTLPHLLAICEQVCRTLAYTHAQGIIHRDLKPANVMVGAFGEVQLMDWGLAKVLTTRSGEPVAGQDSAGQISTICTVRTEAPDSGTQSGLAMGTPAYMAPEQARGEVAQLDERCDVFGLGAILCEVLTGQPPFLGRSSRDVLELAREGQTGPALARLEQCPADRELVELTRRCLAARKGDRPAHGAAVLAALTAYLAGVQERLRQAELDRKAADVRAAEQRKRQRVAFRLGGVIAALLVGLAVGGWWLDRTATQARIDRQEQELRARQTVRTLFDQADTELGAGRHEAAARLLKLIDQRLDALPAGDFRERLAAANSDLALAQELQRLFQERWAVAQNVLTEEMLVGTPGKPFTEQAAPRPGLSGFVPATDRQALLARYASAFRKYGIHEDQTATAEVVRRIRAATIRDELINGLEQWFLLEPKSGRLLDVLTALDPGPAGRTVRQLLVDRPKRPADPAVVKNLEQLDTARPQTALYVAELLPDQAGLKFLKKAVLRYPADSRLLTVLVSRLLVAGPKTGLEAKLYATTAHALRPEDPFDGVLLVWSLRAAGEFESALTISQRVTETHPDFFLGRLARAFVHIDQQAYDAAAIQLRHAVAQNPRSKYARNTLGHTLWKLGQRPEALTELQAAVAIDPEFAAAWSNLGLVHNERGEAAAALRCLTKAQALKPDEAAINGNLGVVYRRQEDLGKAREYYLRAITLDPTYAIGFHNLGWLLNDQKEYEQAIPILQRALALNPKLAPTHQTLAFALNQTGKVEDAIRHYEAAIALDPSVGATFNNLGLLLDRQGDRKNALKRLQQAVKLDPQDPVTRFNLGMVLENDKQLAAAVAQYQAALALDKQYAAAYRGLGVVFLKQGKFPEAAKQLRESLRINETIAGTHVDLGTVLEKLGDRPGAIALFEKAATLDHEDYTAYHQWGVVLENWGKTTDAVTKYYKSLALNPEHAPSLSNLGHLLLEQGDLDGAIKHLERAVAIQPDDPIPRTHLGRALQGRGLNLDASRHLKQALESDPTYVNAHIYSSLCQLPLGNLEGVVAEARLAVAEAPKSFNAHNLLFNGLLASGQFAEAQAVGRQALALAGPDEAPGCQAALQQLAALRQLEQELPRAFRRKRTWKTPEEYLQFGRVARLKQHYAAAQTFYERTWADAPEVIRNKLTAAEFFTLARVNVLAAAGQGINPVPEAERPQCRRQALRWLQKYLTVHRQELAKQPSQYRYTFQHVVRPLLESRDFAAVRPPALDRLPEAERQEWQAFWSDVQQLLAKADAPVPN